MPALVSNPPLEALTARSATPANGTTPVQVVCAWPLSGQYGPFLRFIYYFFVAGCIYARNKKWLENALIVPAIAAIHGIAIAALHVDNAIDMDIYGAFQLCGIGILVAPVTFKLSRTHYRKKGRLVVFLWTVLITIGMLALTYEFYRVNSFPCAHDDLGNPISSDPKKFPYGAMCNLTCSADQGPFSPMRTGSANNIYVIPAPEKITFGMATLFTAGCWIPCILHLISMWNKALDILGRKFLDGGDNEGSIEQTGPANTIQTTRIHSFTRTILPPIEVGLFSFVVGFILVLGEMNFFSPQVVYQNEPVAAIGN